MIPEFIISTNSYLFHIVEVILIRSSFHTLVVCSSLLLLSHPSREAILRSIALPVASFSGQQASTGVPLDQTIAYLNNILSRYNQYFNKKCHGNKYEIIDLGAPGLFSVREQAYGGYEDDEELDCSSVSTVDVPAEQVAASTMNNGDNHTETIECVNYRTNKCIVARSSTRLYPNPTTSHDDDVSMFINGATPEIVAQFHRALGHLIELKKATANPF